MGFGGISTWQLVILLVIIALIFGTRRLRSMGGDLGAAVKGFKKGLGNESPEPSTQVDETPLAEPDMTHPAEESQAGKS